MSNTPALVFFALIIIAIIMGDKNNIEPQNPYMMESIYRNEFITDAEWKMLNKYELSSYGHITDYSQLLRVSI